jgi:hypothetical protein
MMMMAVTSFLAHSTITIVVSDSFIITSIEVLLDFLDVGIVAEKDSKCFLLHSL